MTNALRRALSCVLLFLMAPSLAVMLAIAAAPPAHAQTVRFATPSTLDATIAASRGGDTVVLAGTQPFGAPGAVWRGLANRSFSPPLTIVGPATIDSQWYLYNVAGLALKGVTFRCNQNAAGAWVGGFRVDQLNGGLRPADISLDGLTFTAPLACTANAIQFSRADRVSVTAAAITGWRFGVVLVNVDGFAVRGSVANGMRSDFVQMNRSNNGVLDGNDYVALDYQVGGPNGEHPDAGQGVSWGYSSTQRVKGLVVTNNRARGFAQGFPFLADGCFDDVLIEGNVNEMAMGRGISVACGTNIVARNNRVRTAPYATAPSGIYLPAGAVRCGNVVEPALLAGRAYPGSADAPCAPAVGP